MHGTRSLPRKKIVDSSMPWNQFLFLLDGRIIRTSWWLRFVVPVWLILLDFTVIAGPMPDLVVAAAALTLTGVLLWLAIAVSVKRYHDHDRSGWFLLVALIPMLGSFWVLIELGLLRGTRGPYRFGPDPRRPLVEKSATEPLCERSAGVELT